MRVLVTGGAGFIGSQLVEYHLNNQDVVHVIDDLSTGDERTNAAFADNPNFQFTHADILTYPDLEKLACWADRIYHMAAVVGVMRVINDSERLLATNIAATERLLRAAKLSDRQPRLLLASSSEVYGNSSSKASREDSNLIIGEGKKSCSSYVVSKIAVEYFGLSFYQHYGLRTTSLRIFNTIGPRQRGGYGMVVPRFIKSAVNNEPIDVYGSGQQTRSFCDVRDTVVLMDQIANNELAVGEVLNLGQDQEISINELAHLIKKIANSSSEIRHISYEQAYGEGFEDIMSRRPDLTKLHHFTQFTYQWNLEKTLADLIFKRQSE
jgi:UDP-glucose 4-epimerase